MTDSGRYAVVIPAYNEADRLHTEPFVAFTHAHPTADLLFVNDGSTDATATRLNALAATVPTRIRVLHLARNGGKGEAVRQGLCAAADAGYGTAIYLDADLAAPLETAALLTDALAVHPEVVLLIGSRIKLLGWPIERSARRHYLGRLFATFASLTLSLPVYDTQCGAKAVRLGVLAPVLAEPFLSRWLFDVELIARVRDQLGAGAMRELPLPEWRDTGGSKVRLSDFLRAPLELWRIRRRYPPRAAARDAAPGPA